jgi:hypothetical protein
MSTSTVLCKSGARKKKQMLEIIITQNLEWGDTLEAVEVSGKKFKMSSFSLLFYFWEDTTPIADLWSFLSAVLLLTDRDKRREGRTNRRLIKIASSLSHARVYPFLSVQQISHSISYVRVNSSLNFFRLCVVKWQLTERYQTWTEIIIHRSQALCILRIPKEHPNRLAFPLTWRSDKC